MKPILFVALAVLSGLPSIASAAVVTRSYSFAATGMESIGGVLGPITSVSGMLTATFDPDVSVSAQALDFVSISAPFPTSGATFEYFAGSNILRLNPDLTGNMVPGEDDYRLSIRDDGFGTPSFIQFGYTVSSDTEFYQVSDSGLNGISRTASVVLITNDAVPEPAAWAMMIVGFGLVGGALRLGRRGSAMATMGALKPA